MSADKKFGEVSWNVHDLRKALKDAGLSGAVKSDAELEQSMAKMEKHLIDSVTEFGNEQLESLYLFYG